MTVIAVLPLLAAAGLSAQDDAQAPPAAPAVTAAQGAAMTRLARSAMVEYLLHRTPAESQAVPDALAAPAADIHAVAVTLRRDGAVKAQIVASDQVPGRAVVRAALKAMRSPELPNRVTKAVIEALTVEVEVIAPPVATEDKSLVSRVTPGRTGVRASREHRTRYLLPSEAYAAGLDAAGVKAAAERKLGTPATAWAVFASRHFVAYPDGRNVELIDGKLPAPAKPPGPKELATAAKAVADFLVRHQEARTGRYTAGDDAPVSLREHLHATLAVWRLAARTGATDYATSVNGAMRYVLPFIEGDPEQAHVASQAGADPAATALLLMVLAGQPDQPQVRLLRLQVSAYLRAVLAGPEADTLDRTTRAMGLAALCQTRPAGAAEAPREVLASVVPALGSSDAPADRKPPASLVEAAWIGRALAAAEFGPSRTYVGVSAALGPWLEQHLVKAGPAAGALAMPKQPASTSATALCAAMLAESSGQWKLRGVEPERRAARLLAALLPYCHRMVYKEGEAYFAADPERLVGGVREAPQSPGVTVGACAAAIEAFLAASPAEPRRPAIP